MIVIDATNLILGRFSTFAAKQALLGQEVRVINAEKAIISGAKVKTIADIKTSSIRGTPAKGPFIPKMADRFVRRTIRGMLPYKLQKGTEAYRRVLCYVGSPEEFKSITPAVIPFAEASKLPNLKFITVGEAIKNL